MTIVTKFQIICNFGGINREEIGKWKEKFLKWTNEAESLAREIEESGNYI